MSKTIPVAAVIAVLAGMLWAAPEKGKNNTAYVVQTSIIALPDWQDLKTNRAAYVVDKVDYTNKVSAVSDVPTRQAVRALAACVQDLQAQIDDLKRLLKAVVNVTTNNTVLNQ